MEPTVIALSLQGTSNVPLWVLLLSALAAPVVSVVVTFVALRAGNQREANRLQSEKELKEAEIRREVYRAFALSSSRLGITDKVDSKKAKGRTDVYNGYQEIYLVTTADEVLVAAAELKACILKTRALTAACHDKGMDPAEQDDVQDAFSEIIRLRHEFVSAARKELGLPPIKDATKQVIDKGSLQLAQDLGDTTRPLV